MDQCLISLKYLYLLCVAVLLAHKCYLGQFNPRESQEVNQRLPKSIVGGFTCAHKDYFVLYKESLDERQKGLPSLLAYLTHEANLRIKKQQCSDVTCQILQPRTQHSHKPLQLNCRIRLALEVDQPRCLCSHRMPLLYPARISLRILHSIL